MSQSSPHVTGIVTVTSTGGDASFEYAESQRGKNRDLLMKLKGAPDKDGVEYRHPFGEGPLDLDEKGYHKYAPDFYATLAQVVGEARVKGGGKWPDSVGLEFKKNTYTYNLQ